MIHVENNVVTDELVVAGGQLKRQNMCIYIYQTNILVDLRY